MREFKRVRVRLWKRDRIKQHWHALHRALWLWLARNPGRRKSQWPGWDWNGGAIRRVANNCFACYVSEFCDECKLAWEGGHCTDHGFRLWERATLEYYLTGNKHSFPYITALALKIMNAPLKEN